MRVRGFVLLSILLTASLAVGTARQAEPVVDWIRANAIPLTTPEAGRGFADLQPLKAVVGNARIVALGEATHGSREFFQLKHRMLEFLASEMGFTIFSIEANMPEAYRLNDYVLHGTGDPAALLKGMYFWTWDTEEVLDMIRWMRAFNQSGKGRLQFTGFDMQTPRVAADLVREFATRHDAAYVDTVTEAAALANRTLMAAGGAFGVATATFPVARAAGRTVRYSGYIRTEGVTRGFAGLWWRVDGPAGVLAFDNMEARKISGTTDWTRYSIELTVDAAARNINFGALLPGDGKAWFDDLTIELDGQAFVDATLFDLGFESSTPRGFFTGGAGYRVALDSTIARTGTQSLRMESVGPAAAADAPDPKTSVARWQDVVAHLDAGRARYRASGATDQDIEWAIQNARVVLQGMQMRAGGVSRDLSMAANVKWILDQHPGARIVTWGHNGHVAESGFAYETMGGELRRLYGEAMVVFGFSFHQGAFRAVQMGGGGLRTFEVPPASSATFDATLASAGIPLFALDLRQAPEWFRQPRRTRQIGAVYPDNQPDAFIGPLVPADAYDAILFVERTTAARGNGGR